MKSIVFIISILIIPKALLAQEWDFLKIIDENQKIIFKSEPNFRSSETALSKANKVLISHQLEGFLDSKLIMKSVKFDTLTLLLIKGLNYNINSILIQDIDNKSTTDSVTIDEISSYIERELQRLENIGYPFAEIQLNGSLDSSAIDLQVSIDKGPKIMFDTIIISGEQAINYKSLKRLVEFKPNSPYSEKYLLNLSKNSSTNKFFKLDQSPKVIFKKDSASILLKTKAIKSSRFDGIIGIQPSAEQSTTITGLINLELINSLKKGEEFLINWERLQSQNQRLNLNIKTPFIFNSAASIIGSVNFVRQDSSINRATYDYGVSYRVSYKTRISLSAGRTINNSNFTSSETSKNTKSNNYKAGLIHTSMNNAINPIKGQSISSSIFIGDRETPNEKSKVTGLEIKINKYFKIKKRTTLFLGAAGETINSDNLYENETLLIGGLGTIRGTDQRVIPTTSWITGTTEFRYLLDEQSNVFAFFEKNFYEKNTSMNYTSGTINATGLGFSIGTKTGVFSFIYGVSDFNDNTFLIRNAKINFGYISTF